MAKLVIPSEHETHLKRFQFRIKAFQYFWNASEMHLKRIFWISWIRTNEGILDVHVMRIQNAFRYAHSFRILDAHSIRISDAHLMCISIASTYAAHWNASETHLICISGDGHNTFDKSIIYALIKRIWKAFKYAHCFRILDSHSVRIVDAH